MDSHDQISARTSRRLKVFQPAEVECRGTESRAHLLDLSTTGALVHCAAAPDAGQMVTLRFGPVAVEGRIVWARGPRFGVHFRVPLTDMEVAGVTG